MTMPSLSDLKPWHRGPFQLIQHADGHLRKGGDFDRIIALIGFDQAIEICIDVFVNLDPQLRGNYQIDDSEPAKGRKGRPSFFDKLRFLHKFATEQGHTSIFTDHMVWYHALRNNIYHQGNGIAPERHVVEGARAEAVTVFQTLFGVDITHVLGLNSVDIARAAREIPAASDDPRMEVLRWLQFVEFILRFEQGGGAKPRGPEEEFRQLFNDFFEYSDLKSLIGEPRFSNLRRDVDRAIQVRDRIVCGNFVDDAEATMAIEALKYFHIAVTDI